MLGGPWPKAARVQGFQEPLGLAQIYQPGHFPGPDAPDAENSPQDMPEAQGHVGNVYPSLTVGL